MVSPHGLHLLYPSRGRDLAGGEMEKLLWVLLSSSSRFPVGRVCSTAVLLSQGTHCLLLILVVKKTFSLTLDCVFHPSLYLILTMVLAPICLTLCQISQFVQNSGQKGVR